MWRPDDRQPDGGETPPPPPPDAAVEPASDPASTSETTAGETTTEYRGAGIMWGAIALVVLAAVFVILAVQNTHDVTIDFLWMSLTAPLTLVIAVAMAVTFVIDEVVGLVWRRRRRARRRDRDELRRLRRAKR